jgi:hypothetical protein
MDGGCFTVTWNVFFPRPVVGTVGNNPLRIAGSQGMDGSSFAAMWPAEGKVLVYIQKHDL